MMVMIKRVEMNEGREREIKWVGSVIVEEKQQGEG